MRKKRVLLAHNSYEFINKVDQFFQVDSLYTLTSYALNGEELVNKINLDNYDMVIVKNALTYITGLYALEVLLSKTKQRPDFVILITPFLNEFLINKCERLEINYLHDLNINLSELPNLLFNLEIKNLVKNKSYFDSQMEIISLLKKIGLLKTYVGYSYFEYVLNYMLEKSENIYKSMKNVYYTISGHFNVSATSVEKAMRTCIKSSLSQSQGFYARMLFGHHENDFPSTSVFLQICIQTLKEQKSQIINNNLKGSLRKI